MTQSNTTPSKKQKERASILHSKASVTIEAALTLPLFFFAALSLIYMLEIQAVRTTVRTAAHHAVKIAAQDAVLLPIVNPIKVNSDMVKLIGAGRMDQSIITGGSGGLNCLKSYMLPANGEIRMIVEYRVNLPFPKFTNLTAKLREEVTAKSWTGYVRPGAESDDDQIVYITNTALVYHEDYQCTYLQLSIRFVPYSSLGGLRNEDGGKYRKCDKCVHGSAMAGVYITGSGNKYHNSLTCSGLKRTIHAVPKSEVGGRSGCSRCSK